MSRTTRTGYTPPRITDMHVHVYPAGKSSAYVRANMRSTKSFGEGGLNIPTFLARGTIDRDFTPEEYLRQAQPQGVQQAMLMPVAVLNGKEKLDLGRAQRTLRSINTFHAEAQSTHAGKLISLGTLHPSLFPKHPAMIKDELDYIAANFIGVKFHPFLQNIDPADPRLQPLFAEVARRVLIMQFHMSSSEKNERPHTNSPPRKIMKIYEDHCARAGLPMIWAHLGGHILTDYVLEFLVDNPLIFLDLAYTYAVKHVVAGTENEGKELSHDPRYDLFFSLTELRNFERIIDKVGPGRLLAGTDWPFADVIDMRRALKNLFDELGLSTADRDLIYYQNSQRFFGEVASLQPANHELLLPFAA